MAVEWISGDNFGRPGGSGRSSGLLFFDFGGPRGGSGRSSGLFFLCVISAERGRFRSVELSVFWSFRLTAGQSSGLFEDDVRDFSNCCTTL